MHKDYPFKDRTVKVSKELAQMMLDLPDFVGDRVYQQTHAEEIAMKIWEGSFPWEAARLIIIVLDGKKYRADGQHWSHTVIDFLEPKDYVGREIELRTYTVQNEDEFRDLYSRIDTNRSRSTADQSNALMLGTEEMKGCTRSQLAKLVAGYRMAMWEDKHERTRHSMIEISKVMRGSGNKVARAIQEVIGARTKESAHLHRGPTIAAMFLTFAKAPEASSEFWVAVRTGAELPTGDARLKLRNYLLTHAVGLGVGKHVYAEPVAPEEMLRICLVAWRAWRQKRAVQYLRMEGDKRPAVA